MRYTLLPAALALALAAVPGASQEKAAAPEKKPAAPDTVSPQAARLEAELSKHRAGSPEAAATLLALIDLYHDSGRVLGLVRSGQAFVAGHAGHPRHAEAMLKLIDGLVALSRYKETVVAGRQFLERYPQHAQAGRVQQVLAKALRGAGDRAGAAEAYEALWQRLGATPEGRAAGVQAAHLYHSLGTIDAYGKAARVAEGLFDQNPAGEFGSEAGMAASLYWTQAQQWAKAVAAGAKLLARGLPTDKNLLYAQHLQMAENYGRLNQRANAADSLKKALAIHESPDLLARIVSEMHHGSAKAAEIEPVATQFLQKYPTRPERGWVRTALAQALLRDPATKARAVPILAEAITEDARTFDATAAFVRESGTQPAQVAATEQGLKNALAKNPRDGAVLRYYLAFDVYQNALKDKARARQTLRELVTLSPSPDHYTENAIAALLSGAASDDEFKADLALMLKTRRERLELGQYRAYLGNWVARAEQTKEMPARVAFAKAELARADQDPLVRDWLAAFGDNRDAAAVARAALIAPERLKTLTDPQAETALWQQASYYRHHNNGQERPKCVPVFAQLAQRFPNSYPHAISYLEAATDYGPAEQIKAATAHLLKQTPTYNAPDAWRRLFQGLDAAKEKATVKQIYDWITASQKVHGPAYQYSYVIGDALTRADMKDEAAAYWKRSVASPDRNYYEVRACAERLLATLKGPERVAFIQGLLKDESDYHGLYATWLADEYLQAKDLDNFEKVLRAAVERQRQRPFRGAGVEMYPALNWLQNVTARPDVPAADKRRVLAAIRDLGAPAGISAAAALALLEMPAEPAMKPLARLLAVQDAVTLASDYFQDWDRVIPYAQAALTRQEHLEAVALAGSLLGHMPSVDAERRKAATEVVKQGYARMGGLGLTVDESSPLAPLFQATLYLRLGDERLALEAYTAHRALFDQHRNDLPADLVLFVCESHLAAGGDENHNRVEDICRGWVVKHAEDKALDDVTKARVQLLLARNYFKAQRYDVARTEFTTVLNRYPKTPQAVEADFGIGESFLAQKVYDQAQAVFERLANHPDRDVVVRAEFLRGVLASRRGDRDEAKAIFRTVLERVPSYELANQVLYQLSEIYGAEQRYIDQLELLRTVGRLGRASKRWHVPGTPLSIVVQDSDLAVSRGHTRIPVRVVTVPGGDEELIYLRSGGAGKGLFRADLETRLGKAEKNDRVLQLTGKDVIRCDYPEEFKAQFKNVPPPDAEIRVAAGGKLEVASSKIEDRAGETFAQRLEREAREKENADKRVGQGRPADQVKPGNPVYLRVTDPDRDLGDEKDTVTVKVASASGDSVQVKLTETGPHTGVFEGAVKTGDLPAGATASDSAIGHSPLMAIDKDKETAWVSQPDGQAPKWLAVDLKELKKVDLVRIVTPDPQRRAPVRGRIEGSSDGRFWFTLAEQPAPPAAEPVSVKYGRMTRKVFPGDYRGYTTWAQIVQLNKTVKPAEEAEVEELSWQPPRDKDGKVVPTPAAVVWHGQLVQAKAGVMRIQVPGDVTALVIDGRFELPVGKGERKADVWLEAGTHELTAFSATLGNAPLVVTRVRADQHGTREPVLTPFVADDFDLKQPAAAKPAAVRRAPLVASSDGTWTFRFQQAEVRHVRLVVDEYRGDAVAVSHVEVGGGDGVRDELFIPTKADVLALASNDTLEIAPGDKITASYTDELTETAEGTARLLTAELTATYYNGSSTAIAYDFQKLPNAAVVTVRKELARIDPGERIVIEVTDYDEDRTDSRDEVKVEVAINDGKPVELTATETDVNTGIFTREIDTSAKEEKDKLTVKPGDRVVLRYLDRQNTFPGHPVYRESVVTVNTPTEGKVRILATRTVPPPAESKAPPQIVYLPPAKNAKPDGVVAVALEAPLTVEVIDKDAAKDSRSSVTVTLETTDGAKVDVECVISTQFAPEYLNAEPSAALQEGRFVGQVILQLGGKNSAAVVPLTANMPRYLVGGPKVAGEKTDDADKAVVTTVLNLTGKDVVTATYNDAQRPGGEAKKLTARARLATTGTLAVTDAEYKKPVQKLHVGERLYLAVTDADRDRTDERDTVKVEVTTERGEKESVELLETLAHSGVFTGSVLLKATEKPTPGNYTPDNPAVECYFGDTLELSYTDDTAATESGSVTATLKVPVVVGTDGLVTVFSKTFSDEKLAVETQFHIAESYFELFKGHRALGRKEEEKGDLEAGRRVLREVMEDFPNPKYVPRIAYLLGQFAQELRQWGEAVESYQMIVRQYPDHPLAAEAQYKLAQCYEESGDFDQALEAYVTLAATYPKSPLIANVMVRICEHFYRKEEYKVAAQVGEKFLERFENHKWAPKLAFRVGQCYFKAKEFTKAGEAFDRFEKHFREDALASDALFWSGESFRMGNNMRQAFVRYNKCRWDHPASEAAKYARGRLALPEMLQQFEAAADLEKQ